MTHAQAPFLGSTASITSAHEAVEVGEHVVAHAGEDAVEHTVEHEATGAFREGVHGGEGLGKLADSDIRVSEKGLNLVEDHLARFGENPENSMMVDRLRSALEDGRAITGADASFYMHEAHEATLMNRGMEYAEAHTAALEKYGVSPFSVYHPDVIRALPGLFNGRWFEFWGMQR